MSEEETLNILSIREFARKHPTFSEASLRWLRFGSNGVRRRRGGIEEEYRPNGFASAWVQLGRRVLIDEGEFFRCVTRNNGREVAEGSGRDPEA